MVFCKLQLEEEQLCRALFYFPHSQVLWIFFKISFYVSEVGQKYFVSAIIIVFAVILCVYLMFWHICFMPGHIMPPQSKNFPNVPNHSTCLPLIGLEVEQFINIASIISSILKQMKVAQLKHSFPWQRRRSRGGGGATPQMKLLGGQTYRFPLPPPPQ